MDLKQFQKDAVKTESHIDSVQVDLDYLAAVLQIFVASGNLLDQIKKNVYYDKPIDNEDRAELVKNIIAAMDTKELFKEDPTADKSIMDVNTRLFHAIVGCATESTELIENLASGKKIDVVNMFEESFDISWYQSLMYDEMHVDWENSLQVGLDKLKHRYPDKFTTSNATIRDLDGEREILSSVVDDKKH